MHCIIKTKSSFLLTQIHLQMKQLLPILKTKLFTIGFLFLSTIIIATTATVTINYSKETKELKVHSNDNKVAKKSYQKKVLKATNELNTVSVTTDKPDYSPGEYVIITGDGWDVGETVNLHLLSDCGCVDTVMTVIATNGSIYHDEFLITSDHIGASFVLTATGENPDHVAQTTFTDNNFRIKTNILFASNVEVDYTKYEESTSCADGGPTTSGTALANEGTGNVNFTSADDEQSVYLTAPEYHLGQPFRYWKVTGPPSGSGAARGSRNLSVCVPGGNNVVNITLFYGDCEGTPPDAPEVEPLSFSICAGQTANLNATTESGSVFVFWYTQASGGVSIGSSDGGEDFPVSPTETTTYYAEAVNSNDGCISITRTDVTVTVNPNLPVSVSISSSDADNTICDGTSVTFTATPTNGGASPSYQWKLNGNNVGLDQATYTTTTLTSGDEVTVELTSNATCATGSPATSNAIVTTVDPNLPVSVSISSSDADNTICDGTSVTFTASPTNGGASPSYQWKLNGNNVGLDQATYTTSALVNGDQVSVQLTSNATCATGNPANSNTITNTIIATPATPGSITGVTPACPAATNQVFSIAPVLHATTYTWTVPLGWAITDGQGTTTLTATSSATTGSSGNITVTAGNECGTSSARSLTVSVYTALTVSLNLTGSIDQCVGYNPPILTATPSNGKAPYSYQWKLNGDDIDDETNASYNADAINTPGIYVYSVQVTDACGTVLLSVTRTVNIAPDPTTTVVQGNATICYGTTATMEISGTPGAGTCGYTWQTGPGTSGPWTDIFPAATNASYTTPALTTNSYYRAVYDCSPASCNQSVRVFTITVRPQFNAGAISTTGETICSGGDPGTIGNATLATGGDGNIEYEWRANGDPIGSSNSSSYNPPSGLTATTIYTRYAKDGTCNSFTQSTGSWTVTVKTLSVAPASASSSADNFCADAGGTLDLSATGGTLGTGAVVSWYTASCGGTLVGTGNPLNISKPTATTTYYARYEGDCNNTDCAEVTVTVKTLSVAPASALSSADNFCADAGGTLDLSATGGTIGTGAVVRWYTASCGGTLVGTGNPLTIGKPTTTTTYYARYEGDCNNSTCAEVTVTVKTLSVAPASASSSADNFCADAGGTLDLSATGGTLGTGAVVSWYTSSCGGTLVGTGNPLTISKPTTTTTYYARYEGDCNITTTCASVLVTVKTLSVAATTATRSANNTCPGTAVTLGITGGSLGTGAAWKWYSGSCTGGTSAGTGESVSVSPTVTTTYYVRAEGDCNTTICRSVTVTVLPPTLITGHFIDDRSDRDTTYTYGCISPVLSVTASGPGLLNKFRWYKSGGTNSGGTLVAGPSLTGTFTVPPALGYGTHYYYATYESSCTTVVSQVFTITVQQQEADAENDGKIYYTGTCMAWTPTLTSNSATVTLSAFIKNKAGDQYTCGDIATARVTFQVKNSSGVWTDIPSAQNLLVDYVDPTNPARGGTANAIVQLNISNNTATQIFDLRVVLGGNYKTKVDCGQAQITVSKLIPGGSISGGVLLCNNTSTGLLRPSTSVFTPSLLGFGVEYVVKGSKVQSPKGKVNVYVPSYFDIDGTNTYPNLNWYKFSSNAIASLAITSPKATFTSKANVSKVNFFTGEIITAIEGNCTMILEIEDISRTGQFNFQDKVGITVHKNAGGIWYSNNWVLSRTEPKAICGGDLTVTGTTTTTPPITSSQGGMKTTETAESRPITVMPLSAKAFPNPTETNFNLFVESGNAKEDVQVTVYNVAGVIVHQVKGAANRNYKFGDKWIGGTYFVLVRQGKETSTLQLMKQ
jgi:hypothetical protein